MLNGTTGLEGEVAPADGYLPEESLVLTAGYLIERKGIAYLIDAIGRLRRAGRRVHLAIVGEGPMRGVLAAQAEVCGVADTVHFLGRIRTPTSSP